MEEGKRQSEQERRVQELETRVTTQLRALAASSDVSLTVSVEELRELERQLTKRETELEAAQSKLATASQHIDEYRQIAQQMENELARYKEAQEAQQASLRQQLATANATVGQLKAAAESRAKEQSNSSATAAQKLAELAEKENMIALQKRQLEELQTALQAEKQTAETMEANYREEFQKHSQDLQTWREKEKEMTKLQTEMANMREKAEVLKKEMEMKEKEKEESEKVATHLCLICRNGWSWSRRRRFV